MIDRIKNICSEIRELELDMSSAAREELQPFLSDIMQTISETLPFVDEIRLLHDDVEFLIDDNYIHSDDLGYVVDEHGTDTAHEITYPLTQISPMIELAFGPDKRVTLDMWNAKIVAEAVDQPMSSTS